MVPAPQAENLSTMKTQEPGVSEKLQDSFSSIQFSSATQSCTTLCNPMNRSTPGLPVHHHLPEFTQTHVHRVSDAIQPSHPLSSPSPPSPIPPSIRVFSSESTLGMRWPKYWSFSFSIIPSKEHPGLISFTMDWLDLLAVQVPSQQYLNYSDVLLDDHRTRILGRVTGMGDIFSILPITSSFYKHNSTQ